MVEVHVACISSVYLPVTSIKYQKVVVLVLSEQEFIADLADFLYVDEEEVRTAERVTDVGLDSVRLPTLVRRWKAQGINIGLEALMRDVSMQHWKKMLCGSPENADDASLNTGTSPSSESDIDSKETDR